MGMKTVKFLLGVAAVSLLAPACASGPLRSGNPGGHSSSHHDQATGRQFPLQSAPDKAEVDRVFDERHPGTVQWLGVWFTDRWFDLLDVASWDISAGRGFGVNAHITEFGQAGLNWWDGSHWGQRGRAWGMWDTSSVDRGLGPFYWIEYERQSEWGTKTLFGHDYKYTGWDLFETGDLKDVRGDWSDTGARVNLFALGAGAAVSPIEAVDFVAGLNPIGLIANVLGYHHPVWDLGSDDEHSQIEAELRSEKGLGQ
jgi:hypothetical protein